VRVLVGGSGRYANLPSDGPVGEATGDEAEYFRLATAEDVTGAS
jgi:hypothetical protein